MTTKNSNFNSLLYYNPVSHGFNPVVSATTYCFATQPVNEGDQVLFTIVTWNVADGDTLYWRVGSLVNLTPNRFISTGDSFTITNNRAFYTIQVTADTATATGPQSYNVIISKTPNGPALTTYHVGVADNSQSSTKTIRIDLSVANVGDSAILNTAPSDLTGSSATITGTTRSITYVQHGTLNLGSTDAALVLPAKPVKTITMWVKYFAGFTGYSRYLIDSRITDTSVDYIYNSGSDGWTSYSVNGAPVTSVDANTFNTIAGVHDTWQFVTLINTTMQTNPITLFARYTLAESSSPVAVAVVEAYDYVLSDTQIANAYTADKSRFDPPAVGAQQITVGYFDSLNVSPNATVRIQGVPSNQWTAITSASAYWVVPGGNTSPYTVTFTSDDGSGTFRFFAGSGTINQGCSFWYVP